MEENRKSKIGTIEVLRCEASYVKEEYRPIRDTHFNQANKKDAFKVTEGKYTMSTTKKGRYIHRSAPYDVQLKKLWRVGRECGRLCVNYRMGHSLEEMGVQLRPTDWTRVIVRKSSSSPPSSPPSSPHAQKLSPPPPPPPTTTSSQPSSPAAQSPQHTDDAQVKFSRSRSGSPVGTSHTSNCTSEIISFTSIKKERDNILSHTSTLSPQTVI